MLISYQIEEQSPTAETDILCREALLAITRDIAEDHGLEMELATAWQEDESTERMQVIFLNTSTPSGPWCVGAIVRRHNGELRMWPRDDESGPIHGSTVIKQAELKSSIEEMVDKFTASRT